MKKRLFKLLFVLPIIFSAESCTVQKYFSVYDGSKSDGTITMFYEVRAFEKPVVHFEQGKQEATLRCKKWGYSEAEIFGASTTQCISSDNYGCNLWRVFYKYQCTD